MSPPAPPRLWGRAARGGVGPRGAVGDPPRPSSGPEGGGGRGEERSFCAGAAFQMQMNGGAPQPYWGSSARGGAAASGQRRSIPPPTAPPPAPHGAFPAFSPGFPPRSRSGLWGGGIWSVSGAHRGGEGGGGPTYCGKRGGFGGRCRPSRPHSVAPRFDLQSRGRSKRSGREGGQEPGLPPTPGIPHATGPPPPDLLPPSFPNT